MAQPADDELAAEARALAAALLTEGRAGATRSQLRRQTRLRRVLQSESGTRLVFSLADRVLRPVDFPTAARQLMAVTAGPLEGVSEWDRLLLRAGAVAARVVPGPVTGLVSARLRHETDLLVYPAEPRPLGRRLGRLWAMGRRPNLNLLGEAILGWQEAERRMAAVEALLRRPDVDCVSVKISAVAAGLSLVDFRGSVERIGASLQRLYRLAAAFDPPKLVNLDMEEHRDLDLTVESFISVLGDSEFSSLTAGLALQAYLPDSHGALERLLPWAAERRAAGGAPIRIRLVKGANLAMEKVDAEVHGWPAPSYPTKADTDASYVALLEKLVEAARRGEVRVGVASHNLFDVALALVVAQRSGVSLDIEMLAGMADDQAEAVARRAGGLLLYVPATTRRDFRNALAYLARRLDENATPEGFLRHALDMEPGSAAWEEQAARFADSLVARRHVRTVPFQTQDRTASPAPQPPGPPGPQREATGSSVHFVNEPDTDLTVPANRDWARAALGRPRPPAPAAAGEADVDGAVGRAAGAAPSWGSVSPGERAGILRAVADVMAAGRADAVAVMASEAGKTFSEADPEASEGVDYARWYADACGLLDEVGDGVASEPLGVVVVSPPWNFPYAIPAGGVLAALAAGNTVILKPSPEAPAVSALIVDQLHEAGVPADVVALVAAPDGPAGQRLVTHPHVGAVVLTGSWETARLFSRWAPHRRLLAETSGKNALVVTATADVDQAVRDLVRSAFGHAGQKCSAASLAIVAAPVHDRSPFLRQLADAVRSLRVGPATDPSTDVGPIVGPFTEALKRALTALDPGESWLVEPRCLDADRRLWSPGVRLGLRPGSWAHLTEWFGPVLGVMRSADLDEALEWQNAVRYGLTAGLHSLDPVEHRRWADAVQAGNAYINRPTTGAIVGRQPFGGWKRSSVGPTAKAGGPNYLIGLRRWRDASPVSVEDAVRSYAHWWDRHFSRTVELARLRSESNELRYRSFTPGMIVRAAAEVPDEELAKAAHAARITGTPLTVSRPGSESAEALAARLAGRPDARLRLLGAPEPEVLATAAELGITVLDEPICSHGRIELVRWLREQVVSRSLHRYGNVVYDRQDVTA
ncbi:MAG TPA: proline dehydrogenase family protein [Acidimicrobiales bacterium]|nr:proline dehydrogenase family protein [Acidimicrobiales bacterium]